MTLKQSTFFHLPQLIKGLMFVALFTLAFMSVQPTFAKSFSYGPTKSGETLWKIATTNLPKKSFSVEQFVYAIYRTNPSAFQSGNINLLLRGITLKIPGNKLIVSTSNIEAKKQINRLQANAKKLSIAKKNSKRFKRQVKKYQKKLRRYRRNSKAWKRTYQRLARLKRNLAVSKRKVIHLNKLFSEKLDLPKNISQKDVDETNKKLAKFTDAEKNKLNTPSKQTTPLKVTNQNKTLKTSGNKIVVDKSNNPKPVKIINQNSGNQQLLRNELTTNQSQVQPPSLFARMQKINWFTLISENLILIAGVINGLILLFVLFKLFERKEEPDFIQ